MSLRKRLAAAVRLGDVKYSTLKTLKKTAYTDTEHHTIAHGFLGNHRRMPDILLKNDSKEKAHGA